MEKKLMKVLCDALHYDFDEDACELKLDLKKTVANLIANNVVVLPDCDKCFYRGRIDSWQVCERCYSDKENQFLDRNEVVKEG